MQGRAQLLARRLAVQEKIARQREEMRLAAAGIRAWCIPIDRVSSVVHRGAKHPLLVAAAALALGVVTARHRRVLRWAGYLTTGLSLYARLRRSVAGK